MCVDSPIEQDWFLEIEQLPSAIHHFLSDEERIDNTDSNTGLHGGESGHDIFG